MRDRKHGIVYKQTDGTADERGCRCHHGGTATRRRTLRDSVPPWLILVVAFDPRSSAVPSSSMREPSRRAGTIILVLATVACFGAVCTYGFTNSEDEGLISRNPMFNPPTAASLREIWTGPHLFLYVPATYTVWWLLAHVAQTSPDETGVALNPWIFHGANLLMH